jgi:soluble lytic murein transglycosylase
LEAVGFRLHGKDGGARRQGALGDFRIKELMQINKRWVIALLATISLGLVLVVGLQSRSRHDDIVRRRLRGDVARELRVADAEELPVHARAYLASDRPWRAAHVLRRYMAEVGDVSDDLRVLAARAEAGWGAWPRVRELLTNLPALDTYEHGIGLYLLGRARETSGDAAGAVESYRAFLALPLAETVPADRAAAQLRLALSLVAAGERAQADAELRIVNAAAGGAAVWLDLLVADALALRGDTAGVRGMVARHQDGVPGLYAWRTRIAAALNAKAIAEARALAAQAAQWARTDGSRAEFLVKEARAALAMGDSAGARSLLHSVVAMSAAGAPAREAAELLQQGSLTPEDHLALARVQRAQGLHAESVEGYRRWLAARLGTSAEQATVHMEHANALFYAERYDEVARALQPIMGTVEARLLHARAQSHAHQPNESIRTYLAIARDFARTGTGAQALFLAAGIHHEENEHAQARTMYRRVLAEYPRSSQMSLSMMRLAGMAFVEKEYTEAARIWDQYRTRFPRGEHILEATYWSGRARELSGDSVGAAALFRAARNQQRDSYYALQAGKRLGEPFWPLPMSSSPPESVAAARVVDGWMKGIDLLQNAGFPDHASAEVDRVVSAAGNDSQTLYALAEALAERGYAQRAIRIGLRLDKGLPNRRLLRVLYPFPHRTLITEEARGRDLDPFVAAALIRQESMFEARATSHVGARGLMQIMPATGAKLAAAAGMSEWHAELLYHPEINVHLGTRYLTQHMRNYDGSLPSVFSAYNAGAHRVEWWSDFDEYRDDELFTERIPFQETRDYVKILTRNHALYSGLYGEGS